MTMRRNKSNLPWRRIKRRLYDRGFVVRAVNRRLIDLNSKKRRLPGHYSSREQLISVLRDRVMVMGWGTVKTSAAKAALERKDRVRMVWRGV